MIPRRRSFPFLATAALGIGTLYGWSFGVIAVCRHLGPGRADVARVCAERLNYFPDPEAIPLAIMVAGGWAAAFLVVWAVAALIRHVREGIRIRAAVREGARRLREARR